MKKDKKRDMIRAILPSKARKSARDSGRAINRRTRHRAKQALHEFVDPDDFDDSEVSAKLSGPEARHKSEMCWRISERRDADKLGPLIRLTKHIKKTSKNDTEAREKLIQLIEPGKNLITEHAMGHADNYLDCPGVRYYTPPENDRDKAARERADEESKRRHNGAKVWGKRKFKRIIKWLIEHQHARLNRALKSSDLRVAQCKIGEDECASEHEQVTTFYEVYDASHWSKWRRCYTKRDLMIEEAAGEKVRTRTVRKMVPSHNKRLCNNTLIARKMEDYLVIAKTLSSWDGCVYENDFSKKDTRWSGFNGGVKSRVLSEIKILVDKFEI